MPPILQFEQAGINADRAFIHDDEKFKVQWNAQNVGTDDKPAFADHLVITLRPEGCAGPEEQEETVVYDSNRHGVVADFEEPDLPAGTIGPLMAPEVGPFAVGAYRLTVTLDEGGKDSVTLFSCVDIVAAT